MLLTYAKTKFADPIFIKNPVLQLPGLENMAYPSTHGQTGLILVYSPVTDGKNIPISIVNEVVISTIT